MELKAIEECHVSPPADSVPDTSLPLTFFDLVFLPRPPVQRLYFYESNHSDINFFLPNIKHSLSLTLQHFYPLAGNLTWPQESTLPQLVYKQGDFVSLTVAESDHDFCQLSATTTREAIESTPLIPKFRTTSSDKGAPVLALQVTFFPNQGICIGLTISHAASDGRTSNHFMKTWALFCKLEENNIFSTDSYPFYNRSTLSFLKPREILFLNHLEKANITQEKFHTCRFDHEDPVDKIWGTFVLGISEIKTLKQSVSAHIEKSSEVKPTFHFSSFVVTCAYVWACYVGAQWGVTDVGEELECLIVPMDARERLDPPLPVSYFGNCVGGISAVIERSKLLGKDGVAVAAMMIGTAIHNLDINAQIRGHDEKTDKDMARISALPPEQVIGIASSPKFAVYETDFGWGKPKRVEMSSIHTGQAISITECPSEKGALEISLVRKRKEMDAFVDLFENSIKDLS